MESVVSDIAATRRAARAMRRARVCWNAGWRTGNDMADSVRIEAARDAQTCGKTLSLGMDVRGQCLTHRNVVEPVFGPTLDPPDADSGRCHQRLPTRFARGAGLRLC